MLKPLKPAFFILLFVTAIRSNAQNEFKDAVFDTRIKTVQLFREGWNLSNPLVRLNGTDRLVLHFDLLADEPDTYYYTFIHCDRNWKESSVFPSDYIEGLPEDMMEDYKPSFNTRIAYYHYKIAFPNDRMKLKLSGNYIIKVYKTGEGNKPVLTRRFMISEELVKINASAQRPKLTEFFNTGQQLNLSVSFSGMKVSDPYRDFSTIILQNGKWTNARIGLKPDFVGNSELRFNSLTTNTIFPGGNEYRYFDLKSIRYQSEFIRKIDFVGSAYHAFLYPSENREFKPYFYWQDFNGKYYVAIQEGRDNDTDADYVYVYFTLPATNMIEDGEMYVSGGLADWSFNENNRMTWDNEKKQYQCTMLLKQGWYNYEYILRRNDKSLPEPSAFEGNHYETENEYLVLVYYKDSRERYDKLAGTALTNTTKKVTIY